MIEEENDFIKNNKPYIKNNNFFKGVRIFYINKLDENKDVMCEIFYDKDELKNLEVPNYAFQSLTFNKKFSYNQIFSLIYNKIGRAHV